MCIASIPDGREADRRDHLRAAIAQVPLHEARTRPSAEVDALIEDNVRIITQLVDEDDEMDLDVFDLCRTAVLRDGVRFILLDPWNEIEHKRRRDENETDYISRALRAIKKFAKQYQVAFWIVAHPTKPHDGR
ncbi:AAA family ATPase [Sphingomonas sp. MMS24-JH45]